MACPSADFASAVASARGKAGVASHPLRRRDFDEAAAADSPIPEELRVGRAPVLNSRFPPSAVKRRTTPSNRLGVGQLSDAERRRCC